MRFVDTNVLVYRVSGAPRDLPKREIAINLLEQDDWCLSVQVLEEFYVQTTRPSRSNPLTHAQATGLIESWLRFPVQDITVPIMQSAFAIKQRYGLSYWDSAVIAAAGALGRAEVYSEDIANQQDYGGVRVVNPFQ